MLRFLQVLAVLILLALPASAQAPRRVALVIGNADYAHAGRLANPLNDARLVAAALARAGFQTVDAKNDLGHQAFGRALRDFRARAQGAQVALVYYAGHGIEANGKNWLIPTDAKLASEYDLTFEAIALDQVLDALVGASVRVALLDACRDNPLGRSWTRGTRALNRGLAAIEADDVLVIFAAGPGQIATDGAGVNSPFALALGQRLPEPGLAIQLLGGRVRDDVLRATTSIQRPFVSASVTGEPFYLVAPVSGAAERRAEEAERRARELEKQLKEKEAQAPPQASPPMVTQRPEPVRRPGEVFDDCGQQAWCPKLVVIPAGSFVMGGTRTRNGYESDEGPQQTITITKPFALGRFEVTRGQFAAFAQEEGIDLGGDCYVYIGSGGSVPFEQQRSGTWRSPGFRQSEDHPVVCVSWQDAKNYIAWLSRRTGETYYLPSEAQWEYSARATIGSSGDFSFTGEFQTFCSMGNGGDQSLKRQFPRTAMSLSCDDTYAFTAPVGRFPPNAFGLFDMHGNAAEMTEDCYTESLAGHSSVGTPTRSGSCEFRVLRGGAWISTAQPMRLSNRDPYTVSGRTSLGGFRVARALE